MVNTASYCIPPHPPIDRANCLHPISEGRMVEDDLAVGVSKDFGAFGKGPYRSG